jgi:hypothetical protein
MTERPHQKCDRRGRRRRRSSRSPLHGLLLFEGGAGTLAARTGRIFTSHVEHQRKRRIKKGAVGRDGIAPLPIQRWSSTVTWSAHLSLSLSPSRVRPGTILSHAMHFLSARTRTCRLSVHALRAMAQRRRLRGTRAVIDVHCMCWCCPSAHCACQPHHRPAPTAVAVRRSRCCMVACVHAMHTGLTHLRASRQRPIGKAKRRRGRTGRRTPAEETEVTSRTSQRRRGRAGDGECDHLDAVPNVTSHPAHVSSASLRHSSL